MYSFYLQFMLFLLYFYVVNKEIMLWQINKH
nr:MAG TPA: hypothetical protein [Caudoviricetes sp.]